MHDNKKVKIKVVDFPYCKLLIEKSRMQNEESSTIQEKKTSQKSESCLNNDR